MKKLLNFNSINFVLSAYLKPLYIVILMGTYIFFYNKLCVVGPSYKILGIVVTTMFTLLFVWFVGLYPGERKKLVSLIKQKIF